MKEKLTKIYVFVVTLVTGTTMTPKVWAAGPADLQAGYTDTMNFITQITQWASGIGMAVGGLIWYLKWTSLQNAHDEQDAKQAKRAIKFSIMGTIGALLVFAIMTTLKEVYK